MVSTIFDSRSLPFSLSTIQVELFPVDVDVDCSTNYHFPTYERDVVTFVTFLQVIDESVKNLLYRDL